MRSSWPHDNFVCSMQAPCNSEMHHARRHITTDPHQLLAVQVFVGAMLALSVMTVLAVVLGWAAPALVSSRREAPANCC